MNTLGNKIRVFRRLKGLSQLDLEVLIGASSGVISRIESNVTNPNKETIFKIIESLDLNKLQVEYLIGRTAFPPTENEIKEVIDKMSDHLKNPMVFGYILDDRNRLIKLSNGFKRLAKFSNEDLLRLEMEYFTNIVTSNDSPAKKFLSDDDFERAALNVFRTTYVEMHFMEGDECYEEMVDRINQNELSIKLWRKAEELESDNYFRDPNDLKVKFKFLGISFDLDFYLEPIYFNPRFRMVEYRINNRFSQLIKKFNNNEHIRK